MFEYYSENGFTLIKNKQALTSIIYRSIFSITETEPFCKKKLLISENFKVLDEFLIKNVSTPIQLIEINKFTFFIFEKFRLKIKETVARLENTIVTEFESAIVNIDKINLQFSELPIYEDIVLSPFISTSKNDLKSFNSLSFNPISGQQKVFTLM